jgi:hypothetical protein
MGRKMEAKKQHCIDCHFLMKERTISREIVTSASFVPRRTQKTSLTTEQRKLYRNKEWKKIFQPNNEIGCYHNVWDNILFAEMSIESTSDCDYMIAKLNKTLYEVDRKNNCFYWKYRENIALEGAEKLQKREWELTESSKEKNLIKKWIIITWVLIGLTFLALIVDTLFRLCEK